jgi:alpha-mannosidase
MKKKHVFPDEQLHADIPEIQNGRFRITADDHGILSIYDKKLKRVISKAGDLRPGEFILEHDEGSPWATLSSDRKRTLLSDSTSIAGIRKGAGYERLSYLIMPEDTSGYVIRGLKIKYDITLYEGMDRIEFKAEVFWDTYNHRLRIAMPVEFSGKQLYEIPYGVLERKPYKPDFGWLCAGGDWPAINWAGVSDSNGLAVLLNKGLPSYSMEDNGEDSTVILLSVLRSPCIPTYLHEPLMHSMTEWDGIRDAGTHSFEYALMAYENPCDYLKAIQDAEIYNSGLYAVRGNMDLPVMPSVISGSIRISCVKAAEKGNAAVVRLVETEGSSRPAIVAIPDYIKEAYRVNLLEREEKKLDIIDGNVRMDMHPFEIATLRLERG